MKTRLILLTIILNFPFIGCVKDEVKKNENIDTSSISFTGCSLDTKSIDTNTPSIRLIGQTDGKLTVKMINTEFCCGTESISINKTFDASKIRIEIIDNGPFTYCYCSHNLEFLITNLDKKDYEFTIIESEHSYSRDTFKINIYYISNLDTTICK